MMRRFLLLGAVGVLLVSAVAVAQEPKPAVGEEVGYLGMRREHVRWPTPESVARDLRSSDEQTRLNAFHLLGLTDQQVQLAVWSQTSPSQIVGNKVATPDQVRLAYAALGEDATQQAILAVQISEAQTTAVAIATPADRQWKRVAAFVCWCKYEMYVDRDALTEFVQLHPAPQPGPATPQHFELVLRASGGGTGIYTQDEAHFRMHGGELRRVLSFVCRRRSCDQTAPAQRWCAIEKRWFYTTAVGNEPGGILAEARGKFASDNQPLVQWSVRDLENRYLQRPTCTSFKWNAGEFRYERLRSTPNPCLPTSR
ncbi:MAG: hypothetical protein LAN70_15905 [Acidobacteriia bacterium]|nr:hypothetical protein [Terriglobia bacterium]